jgi:acyl-homoserine lactone acylase PvdQ
VTFLDALRGDTDYEWFDGRRDELIREALAETAEALEDRFESPDPAHWLEPVHKSRFRPLGGTQVEAMDMRNRATYNQVLDADGWQSDDEATWQATAGDVIPPGNSGLITADELVQAQAGQGEPDRLTNQLDLYINNEYRPHPVSRTQVEQVAVESTTVRTVSRPSPRNVTLSSDVSPERLSGLREGLETPEGFADD